MVFFPMSTVEVSRIPRLMSMNCLLDTLSQWTMNPLLYLSSMAKMRSANASFFTSLAADGIVSGCFV